MKNITPYKFIISQRRASHYIICPKCGMEIIKPTDKIVECLRCKNKIRIIIISKEVLKMNKCKKCAYYDPLYNKCNNFGSYVECKKNCDRYKREAWPYSEKELETFSDEDLIELYEANYRYALCWEGEATLDYVVPPKRELKKRGYKVNGCEVTKEELNDTGTSIR